MELSKQQMELSRQNMKSSRQNINLRVIFVITLLIAVSLISYMTFRVNYLRQQLSNRESQLLELKNSKDILERQLQDASLKLAALNSANNFLEKDNERLTAMRDSLQSQLNMITEQLSKQQEIISGQQEIITSLQEANSKLDTVISQIGYLYLHSSSAPPPKGNKGKVNVLLTPAEEK